MPDEHSWYEDPQIRWERGEPLAPGSRARVVTVDHSVRFQDFLRQGARVYLGPEGAAGHVACFIRGPEGDELWLPVDGSEERDIAYREIATPGDTLRLRLGSGALVRVGVDPGPPLRHVVHLPKDPESQRFIVWYRCRYPEAACPECGKPARFLGFALPATVVSARPVALSFQCGACQYTRDGYFDLPLRPGLDFPE